MAYTDQFLLSAELTRQRVAARAETEKATAKLTDFLKLQVEAAAIERLRLSESKSYEDLGAKEGAVLVWYDFAARDAKGASKISSKVACAAYLNGLASGALAAALASPPRLEGKDVSAARLLLAAPATGFGNVGIQLPKGIVPIPAPPWLENALDPSRPEAGQLTGCSILFNWPDGGWAVGVLGKPNMSKTFKVDGVIANFRAKYAVDGATASHVLSLTGYAADAGAEEDSWVLLGPAKAAPLLLMGTEQPTVQPKTPLAPLQPALRLPAVCYPTASPADSPPGLDDATLSALSPDQQAALMVRLSGLLSGAASPSDAALPRP